MLRQEILLTHNMYAKWIHRPLAKHWCKFELWACIFVDQSEGVCSQQLHESSSLIRVGTWVLIDCRLGTVYFLGTIDSFDMYILHKMYPSFRTVRSRVLSSTCWWILALTARAYSSGVTHMYRKYLRMQTWVRLIGNHGAMPLQSMLWLRTNISNNTYQPNINR